MTLEKNSVKITFLGTRGYISVNRPIIRQKNGKLFGHTTIRAQLGWCQQEGISQSIFTHSGTQIVAGDERTLGAKVRMFGKKKGVEARIAYDGMELVVR